MRVLLLFVVLATAAASNSEFELLEKFKEFVHKFERKYHNVEEFVKRMKIFHDNTKHIEKMNGKDDGATYSHLSPLADMSQEEFTARNTLKVTEEALQAPVAAHLPTDDLPKSFDWREKGAVNKIKNQGQCGSCWAFGTAMNIEGAAVVQGKQSLQSLSEQELVDCDTATGDMGCNGGLPLNAYKDMIKNNFGLVLESAYPYKASVGKCTLDKSQEKVFINDYMQVANDEDQIAAHLVKYGPLVIGINAGPMQFYFGGIANPWFCNPYGIDHAVGIVGYGEENGTKYWIVRNSWGESWGEKGYYRIVRGKGKCGLNRMVTTAIIKPQQTEKQAAEIFV